MHLKWIISKIIVFGQNTVYLQFMLANLVSECEKWFILLILGQIINCFNFLIANLSINKLTICMYYL